MILKPVGLLGSDDALRLKVDAVGLHLLSSSDNVAVGVVGLHLLPSSSDLAISALGLHLIEEPI